MRYILLVIITMLILSCGGGPGGSPPAPTTVISQMYEGGYVGYYMYDLTANGTTRTTYALYTSKIDRDLYLYDAPDPTILLATSVWIEVTAIGGINQSSCTAIINTIRYNAYCNWK